MGDADDEAIDLLLETAEESGPVPQEGGGTPDLDPTGSASVPPEP